MGLVNLRVRMAVSDDHATDTLSCAVTNCDFAGNDIDATRLIELEQNGLANEYQGKRDGYIQSDAR